MTDDERKIKEVEAMLTGKLFVGAHVTHTVSPNYVGVVIKLHDQWAEVRWSNINATTTSFIPHLHLAPSL